MLFKIEVDRNFIEIVSNHTKAITEAHISAVKKSIITTGEMAAVKLRELAAKKLNTTRQIYEDHISNSQIGDDTYEIRLGAGAAYIEKGYPSFDMLQKGLARGNANKKGKPGYENAKYNFIHVPFSHSPAHAKSGHSMHNVEVQRGQLAQTGESGGYPTFQRGQRPIQAMEQTKGSLALDLKFLKETFGLGGNETNNGVPAVGKVWQLSRKPDVPVWTMKNYLGEQKTGAVIGIAGGGILTGIEKHQTVSPKGKVTGHYYTFRTASENPKSKSKWIHSGWEGAHLMPELEKWIYSELTKTIQEVMGD